MATEKHPLKVESSRELLALFLSPGSTRTPLLNVDEIKEILEREPASPKDKDRKVITGEGHSNGRERGV